MIGGKWFFLRGLVREQGHWSGFLEHFQKSFPDCEVCALDLPGNGSRYHEDSPTTIRETAQKVREEFLKKRGSSNHLFAISLGAMTGIQWMNDFPDDFQTATLVNTSLRGLSPFYRRLMPNNYATILKMFFSQDPHFRERSILEMTSQRPERFSKLEKDWVAIQEKRPVSTRNALRQILAALRFSPPQKKPDGKLLLLCSQQDQLVSPSCSAALAKHWQVPLFTNPRAGHDLTLDEPDWVIDTINKFY